MLLYRFGEAGGRTVPIGSLGSAGSEHRLIGAGGNRVLTGW